jgi:hypothetical protein
MILSLDGLRQFTVKCTLTSNCHSTYVVHYRNVDDKALLGKDSVKQQWKRSDRCCAMTQYTRVNNGDEDVFRVVGAVVISRV